MRGKLTLDLDDLRVDSFDTTTPPAERGTVVGQQQCTCYTCTCPGCPTCGLPTCDRTCPDTCAFTCADGSCGGTCDAACSMDPSCYQSCGGTCDYTCSNCTNGVSCATCPPPD